MKKLRPWWIFVCIAALNAGCGNDFEGAASDGTTAGTTGFPGAATTMGSADGTTNGPGTATGSGTTGVPVAATAGTTSGTSGGTGTSGGPGLSGGTGSTTGAPTTGGTAIAGDGGLADAGTGVTDASVGNAGDCDRACLLEFMQGYIDALEAQDSSMLEVSGDLVYTENGSPTQLGQTVWQIGVSVQDGARLDFADPVSKNVASQFWFKKSDNSDSIYQVRLKVEDRLITEIEALAINSTFEAANFFFSPQNLKPEAVFLETVDPADRMSREELLALTELYVQHLEGKSGSELPFDDGCKRYENGVVTANGAGGFAAQSWSFDVTRRIPVVDEEAQITWGMLPFSQDQSPLVVGEAFKLIKGKIMMIQAVMGRQPIGPFAGDDIYVP